VTPLESGILARRKQLRGLGEEEIVFVQKRLLSSLWVRMLRKRARRVVYDFDDAVFLSRSESGVSASRSRRGRFAAIVKAADHVIAANDYLAAAAREHTSESRVSVLPIAVDLSRWPARREWRREPGERITIGWMGSPANHPYFSPLKPVLAELLGSNPALQLKIVSDKPIEVDGASVHQKPFHEDEEVADLHSFDVALAPYPDDDWTRGKSPGKLVAYMASYLPVVGSDVTCVRRIIRNNVNGVLAESPGAWLLLVRRLSDSLDLRKTLGSAARATIEEGYDIRRLSIRYAELLRSLA